MEKLTLGVVLGAALGSGFKTVFGQARTELSTLGQEIQRTTKLQSQIGKVGDHLAGIEKLEYRLRLASTAAMQYQDAYEQAKKSGAANVSKLYKDMQRAVEETNKIEAALHREQKALQTVGDGLRKAGIDTRNLDAENQRLGKTLDQQTEAFLRQKEVMERRAGAKQELQGEVLKIGATVAYLKTATGNAIAFESAMADVKKVVNFDNGDQIKAMGQDILKLSTQLPMTAEGIAAIVAAGGQAGFAREELLKFAEDAGKMGVAFDTSADEAGQMMAQWRTSFSMGQDQVRGLADQINYLGNTGPANAKKISDIVTRIGPLGEVAGLASGQIAAVGATVAGMGIAPEIAATGIKNLMLALNAGASATKSQSKAFDDLGLDAEVMAKRMQTDAAGAIQEVLQKIRELPKEQQAATLDNLFGKESIGAIAPLLTKLDLLKVNLAKVGDASKYAGSMEQEFLNKAGTTQNGITSLGNSFNRVSVIVGNVFTPMINLAAGLLGGLLNVVADTADKFPFLTNVIVVGTVAWIGYRTAVAAATFATTFIPGAAALGSAAMAGMSTVVSVAGGIIGGFTTVMRVLWAVMMANPVIAIGAAIVGVAILVYKYWEPISAFVGAFFDKIKAGVQWLKTSAVGKFFTGGDNKAAGSPAATPTTAASSQIVRKSAAAAVVATAAATTPATAKPVQVHQTNAHQITVQAAPGQSPQDIAREVSLQIERRDREKAALKRGGLYDSRD